MKKNYIIALILLLICFGLLITSLVFDALEKETMCMFFGMASTGVAFLSCLFGLNSWKEQ